MYVLCVPDGIWDVMTSQNAVDFVAGKFKEGKELKEILSDLFDQCLSPHPSANDVSPPARTRSLDLDLDLDIYHYKHLATPNSHTLAHICSHALTYMTRMHDICVIHQPTGTHTHRHTHIHTHTHAHTRTHARTSHTQSLIDNQSGAKDMRSNMREKG